MSDLFRKVAFKHLATWHATDEILEAERTRSIEPFKYGGPPKRWIHMIHADMEDEEFPGNPTLHIDGDISVSSFNRSSVFPVDHAGRRGYVLYGKPSYHFPFDSNSVRNPETGEREFGWETLDLGEMAGWNEPMEWDEAWLNPSKSKLEGFIWASDANDLDDVEPEGVDFLKSSPTGRGWIRLRDGSLHEV